MKELNKKVKDMRLENMNRRIAIKELKDVSENYEKIVAGKVTDEKDNAGKAVYSNDKKRELETAMRLSEDKIYQEMISNIKNLEKEFNTAQIEIDYLTWELTLSSHHNEDIVAAIDRLANCLKR